MEERGYIYVMINPSIEGLVKIGRTTRNPESRAKELSQATGVPTPFYVAFSIEVHDCHAAEQYVYAVLEHNGFKRSPNREFFEMPLRSAVKVLTLVEQQLQEHSGGEIQTGQATHSETEDDFDNKSSQHPGAVLLEKAVNLYYGADDEIKDKEEALRLMQRSAALNFAPAFTSLAEYFNLQARETGVQNDEMKVEELGEKAIAVLKEGGQKGYGRCYVKLADFYEWGKFDLKREPGNATKCWKKYFRSATFVNDDDRKWGESTSIGNELVGGASRVSYACDYLRRVFSRSIPLDLEILQILRPLKSEIIEEIGRLPGGFLEFVESKL